MHGKTVHWGICSTGRISQDFVNILRSLPQCDHQVRAVAASSLERAQSFAKEHSIPRTYGKYEELTSDADLDIIYIGSITSQHYVHAKMMLESGKAVLCEKPLCTSVNEMKSLFALAKANNVFFMEAIWSRCFPLYKAVRQAIDDDEIGDVKMVQSSFGSNFHAGPNHRINKKELGGGALFDIGIYQVQLSQFVFREKPEEHLTTGFLNEYGVDIMSGMTLKYSNNRLCSMATSVISFFPNEASICGTKGYIKIHGPFWCPTTFTINGETREFPLPPSDKDFIFTNSQGLGFEAEEVRRCLMEKLLESPLVTHAMSIEIAEILERARKDLGYHLPTDEKE